MGKLGAAQQEQSHSRLYLDFTSIKVFHLLFFILGLETGEVKPYAYDI